jgi:Fic/DOC family protein
MGLRLEPSVAAREGRLARLLAERGLAAGDARLARIVEDAELVGSLELAGLPLSWDDARAEPAPPALQALRRARAAVPRDARLTLAALRAWHEALAGPRGFRRGEAAGAPAEFIEDRLASLAEWLEARGAAELSPEQKACVALARIVEIRPFDEANGRVARLAAAHVLKRAGLQAPILVGGDGPRLRAALEAAHRLETGPLVQLVREASGRALDVMIQSLERGLV